jgi:isopropylmalate/homocitrate/citramalate synthase
MQVTEVLRTTVEENRAMIRDTVAHLVKHGREVIYDAEHFFDGYKDSPEHALATLEAAAEGGASASCSATPTAARCPPRSCRSASGPQRIPGTPFGIHTHNDCELGVANAIAAVKAGAIQIQGTINGYGERTGNCNLTSVIPILQLKMGIPVVPHLEKLRELSYFVDDVSNNPHFARAPFVGRTAFAHKGGMHVNAVQKLARSYEHIEPASVGNRTAHPRLRTQRPGQHPLKAEQLGLPLEKGSDEAKAVLKRVKELENDGYSFEAAGGTLELLIRRELGDHKPLRPHRIPHQFPQIQRRPPAGLRGHRETLVDGTPELTVAEGHGVVNALDLACARRCCRSIRKSPASRWSITRCASSTATTPPPPKPACSSFPATAPAPGAPSAFPKTSSRPAGSRFVDGIDLFLQRPLGFVPRPLALLACLLLRLTSGQAESAAVVGVGRVFQHLMHRCPQIVQALLDGFTLAVGLGKLDACRGIAGFTFRRAVV